MRAMAETKKAQRIENLEKYFLKNLTEDPIDGTSFDCDILEQLKTLKEKYDKEKKNG